MPIKVGAGDVGIYYLKEPIRDVEEGSQLECWVDDNIRGAVIIENAGDVLTPVPTYVFFLAWFLSGVLNIVYYLYRLEIIDHFVTRGNHYVECVMVGEEGQVLPSFKIIGIFAT